MPFSRENRRFTLSLIASVVLAGMALWVFYLLSSENPNNTATIGAAVGALYVVLMLQVFSLLKTGKVEEKVEQGQEDARNRAAAVKSTLKEVTEKVVSSGMPQTPEQLRAFIFDTVGPLVDEAADKAVAKYRGLDMAGRAGVG